MLEDHYLVQEALMGRSSIDEPGTTASCAGRILGRNGDLVVIACDTCSFAHLHPLPSEEDQETLYGEFWDKEIPHFEGHVNEDKPWLWGRYGKLLSRIERLLDKPWNLLDVGCGVGDFLEFVASRPGWMPLGCDPDPRAQQASGRYAPVWPNLPKHVMVSCLTMHNVLEHVLQPREMLLECRQRIRSKGLIVVSVPNDFSRIQKWAARRVGRQWWIHRHHVNYFTPQSLQDLLRETGFEVVHRTTTFPMELFLLFTDYTKKASTGRRVHKLRKAIDACGLRVIYPLLARFGLGRHITMVARKV